MLADDHVAVRRAIEALRSGVPSRHAVAALGGGQPAIEMQIRRQLEDAARNGVGRQTPGTLIAGGFGAGKSHLLEYIQSAALAENFICSKIVISKETPLYDPVKVYRAAITGARIPGRHGAALTEVAATLDVKSPAYHDLLVWSQSAEGGLHARFAALTSLLDVTRVGPEARDQIVAHLAGERLGVAQIRAWLREIQAPIPRMPPLSERELSLHRFRYVPRLFAAAGYSGWLLLFDEVELIGRYSLRQRARSYGELARWLGKLPGRGLPGITSVLAITSDFAAAVLEAGGKHDLEVIPNRLGANPRDAELVKPAERGMNAIRRDTLTLRPPDKDAVQRAYEQVRALHARAYDWDPPEVRSLEWLRSRPVREYVRSWITEWDLTRLYPGYSAEVEIEEVALTYDEQPELEVPTEEAEDRRTSAGQE
jgi:hypothetical protein